MKYDIITELRAEPFEKLLRNNLKLVGSMETTCYDDLMDIAVPISIRYELK